MNSTLTSITVKDLEETSLPDPNKPFTIGNYKIYNNELFKVLDLKEGKEDIRICKAIWIDGIKIDIETNQVILLVLFYFKNRYIKIEVPRSIFMERNLQTLCAVGADIPKKDVDEIINFLKLVENDTNNEELFHKSLGWTESKDEWRFLHTKSIGNEGGLFPSSYNGEMHIQPMGTLANWVEAIRKYVMERPSLEFILAAAFSATVNSLLSKTIKQDSLIIHLAGESSTGKTTAARVAVSAFGKPDNEGLIKSWNATFNALLKTLANNNGVPIVLDEASSKTGDNFTTIIYQLAEGTDKSRLSKEAEMRKQDHWNTTIITTAEHKLTEKAAKNNGLVVRVPEFTNIQWTDSAEHARQLKETLSTNNGIAGPFFVEYLIKHCTADQLVEGHRKWTKKILDAFVVTDQFSDRIAEKFASVMLTVELFNRCFIDYSLSLDDEAILQFIAENDAKQAGKRTMDNKAITYIEQFALQNKAKFEIDGVMSKAIEYFGTIKTKENFLEVAIIKNVLDKYLKENGFTSAEVVISELKSKGYINAEDGKNTRKRKVPLENEVTGEVTKKSQVTYVIKLDMDLLNREKESKKPKPLSKLKSPKKNIPKLEFDSIDKILEDDDDDL